MEKRKVGRSNVKVDLRLAQHLLVVRLDDLHVEAVHGGEHVGGALHHDLPVLGHRERCAPSNEHLEYFSDIFFILCIRKIFSHRLVSGTERKLRVEMAADKDDFLVAEPHLAPSVAGHIYPAEEDLLLVLSALW